MDTCTIETSGGLTYRWETRLHADTGARRCPRPTASTSPAAPFAARLPGPPRPLAKEREALSQAPQMRPSSPCYARGCCRQAVVPSSCAPTLKPRGTLGVKRIASSRLTTFQSNFVAVTMTQRNIVTRSTVSQLSVFYRISLQGQK